MQVIAKTEADGAVRYTNRANGRSTWLAQSAYAFWVYEPEWGRFMPFIVRADAVAEIERLIA